MLNQSHDSSPLVYFISGMWCSTCAKTVQEKTLQISGVSSAEISYPTKLLTVRLKNQTSAENVDQQILGKIEGIGFGIKKQTMGWLASFEEDLKKEQERSISDVRIGLVWFLAMWSSMIAIAGYLNQGVTPEQHYYLSLASSIFGLPAIGIGIWPYARSGLRALRASQLWTLDLFIFLGGGSAFLISMIHLISGRPETYADSGSMIIAILLLTKKIENRMARKLSSSILYQINQFQDEVEVFKNNLWIKAKTFQVKKKDRILVKPGETVAFDGTLASAEALVNCHLLSGENTLLNCRQGDHLFAGSIAGSAFEMTVDEPLGQRKIDAWAEAALISGSQTHLSTKFLRNIENRLTTYALFGALGIATMSHFRGEGLVQNIEAFFIGVLIFCPCLFVSILPMTKQMAHLALLKVGVLLQRPEALWQFSQLKYIYLDKTGTLEAVDSDLLAEDPEEKSYLLSLLSELSIKTRHPILRNFSFHNNKEQNLLDNIEEFAGHGVKATIDSFTNGSATLWLGQPKFVSQAAGIHLPDPDSVFPLMALNRRIVGQIAVKAIFDEQAKQFIKKILERFKNMNIEILSGDPNRQAGQNLVALNSQRISYYGNLSPEQKAQRIQPHSLFIGDGLNDTLALATADVSCRVGHRVFGFVPVDIQLQIPDLEIVLLVMEYAKKYKAVQIQTAILALTYNVITFSLAAMGKFSPLGAVLAMLASFSILLVSSLRLLKIPRSYG